MRVTAQPGSLLWSFASTDPILASPAIGADGTIYVGSYDRKFYAITPAGAQKWAFPLPTTAFSGIFSSPAIAADGTVYFAAEDGNLYALDPVNGSNHWTFAVGSAVYSDPAIGADGAIYVGSYDLQGNKTSGALYAINPNGTQRWRYEPADAIYSDPVIAQDGTVYFGCDDGKLYALNTNGTLRWTFNTGPKAITASPAIGSDGKVYVGVGSITNPRFFCVNPDGTTNWVFTATNRIRSSAALGTDGTVYFGSDDSHLYALNPDGTLKWAVTLGGAVGSSPALAADGTIYVGCDDGKVYAFDGGGSNLWTFATSNLVYSSPAIAADGTVYVGSQDWSLYALGGTAALGGSAWPMFRHDIRHTAKFVPNTPPVVSTIPDQLIGRNTTLGPLAFTVSDAETPADSLTVTATSSNVTLVLDAQIQFTGAGAARFVTLTPATNEFGTSLITLTVTDAAGATNNSIFLLIVDDPPAATNDSYAVDEDTTLDISAPGVLANDTDANGDAMTAVLVSLPSHGAVTLSPSGGFSYTPVSNYHGPDMFTYKASDGPTTSAPATVTIDVGPVNDKPLAGNNGYETIRNISLNVSAPGVLGNDTDPDGDTLTAVLVSNVSHGTVTLDTSGAFIYMPEFDYVGPDAFTYEASDGQTNSVFATVTLIVNPENHPPLLAAVTNRVLNEGTSLTITNSASDLDAPPQTLTFALLSAPTNAVINSTNGIFLWTPSEAQGPSTNTTIVIVFDDGSPSSSATQSFDITVREVNLAPVLTVPATQTLDEGTPLNAAATVTDADLPPNLLTFAVVSGPTNLTVATDGTISWTPSETQGGTTNTVKVRVFDDGSPSLSATQSFSIIVRETNVAPVLTVPATQTINEFSLLNVTATATDADIPTNRLTFALASGPPGLAVTTNGAITWTPTEAQGPSTNDVSVRVFDNGVPSLNMTQTFQVVVREVNTGPTLTDPPNQTVTELATLNLTATASDTDLPTNLLTFALVSGPAGLTVSTNGGISWRPDEAQGGTTATVTFRVFDDGLPSLTATQSFQATVQDTNSAPVPTLPPTQTVDEQTLLSFTATAADSDIPTNTLTFARVSAPSGLTVSSSGAIVWTPTETQGPATNDVTVRVTDNGTPKLSAMQTIQIIVREVNRAPVLNALANRTTTELTAMSFTATATDPDTPTNKLTFALVSGPAGLAVSTNGAISWTPAEDQGPGTNAVTVRVFDNGAPSLNATQSFQVTVRETNAAPVLTLPANQTIDETMPFNAYATASDPDAPTNLLTFALVSGPTNMVVAPNGAIAWTPSEAQGGSTNTVRVRVFDNGAPSLSVTQSFQLIVRKVNSAPVLTLPATQTLNELTSFSGLATATDADVPTNRLTFGLSSGPEGLTISTNGAIAWTPTESQSPTTNSVAVRVFDDGSPSLSTTQSFLVIVQEINLAPVLMVPGTQTVDENSPLNVAATATDSDVPPNLLTFALVSGPVGLTVSPDGAIAWTPAESQGGMTNTVTLRVFDDGLPSLSATQSFQIIVRRANSAPVLTVMETQTIDELTPMNVTTTATDSDVPTNKLTFDLVSGPAGLTVATNGAIAWTPAEDQGPATNGVIVRVFDDGSPSLSATQTIQIIVREANLAPVLTVPATHSFDELTALNLMTTATDPDDPANQLTFALVSGPPGFGVSTNGAISWTPAEDQGPSTNDVTVRVFDDGTPSLSATQSFVVLVREVNTPPLLPPVAERTIHQGMTVSFNLAATDTDIPANQLTYTMAGAPMGADLVLTNGLFTWTPAETQANSTHVIAAFATDDGLPSLIASNTFTITVVSRPLIQSIAMTAHGLDLGWTSIPGISYRLQYQTNLADTAWVELPGEVTATATNSTATAPLPAGSPVFYRVAVLP